MRLVYDPSYATVTRSLHAWSTRLQDLTTTRVPECSYGGIIESRSTTKPPRPIPSTNPLPQSVLAEQPIHRGMSNAILTGQLLYGYALLKACQQLISVGD